MKLKLSKEWHKDRIGRESDQEIGDGRLLGTSSKPMTRTEVTYALKIAGWRVKSCQGCRKWYAPKTQKYPSVFQKGVLLREAAAFECLCSNENLS